MKWCVLVLVFAGLTRGDNAIDTNNIFNCPELNAQDEIDLDKVRVLSLSPFLYRSANTVEIKNG